MARVKKGEISMSMFMWNPVKRIKPIVVNDASKGDKIAAIASENLAILSCLKENAVIIILANTKITSRIAPAIFFKNYC